MGAIEISCTYPLEYTKIVMQLNKNQNAMGFANVMKNTVKSNSFFSLYRGYSAMLIFCIPKNSVRFGTYDYVSKNVFT